ncbi:hypothetical protein [Paraburkholderia lacunae]|uniref:hypothetical protein n=1 Tax=Paraburkholderia lacunae TaxID=2211104 RepID=UPI001FCB4AB7|nr:hypothetical protein [Paraburkholderia lacunae]
MDEARRASQTWQQVVQSAGLNIGLNQFPGQHCHADARYRSDLVELPARSISFV